VSTGAPSPLEPFKNKGYWEQQIVQYCQYQCLHNEYLSSAAEAEGTPFPDPTREVYHVWLVHMLQPKAYREDCLAAFGRILPHTNHTPTFAPTFAPTAGKDIPPAPAVVAATTACSLLSPLVSLTPPASLLTLTRACLLTAEGEETSSLLSGSSDETDCETSSHTSRSDSDDTDVDETDQPSLLTCPRRQADTVRTVADALRLFPHIDWWRAFDGIETIFNEGVEKASLIQQRDVGFARRAVEYYCNFLQLCVTAAKGQSLAPCTVIDLVWCVPMLLFNT
jgi:hypothetical protein